MALSAALIFLSFLCIVYSVASEENTEWRKTGAPLLSVFFALMSMLIYIIARKNGWS